MTSSAIRVLAVEWLTSEVVDCLSSALALNIDALSGAAPGISPMTLLMTRRGSCPPGEGCEPLH